MKSISRIFLSLVLCINMLGTGFLAFAGNPDNEEISEDVVITSDEPGFAASTDEDDDLWETISAEDKDKVEKKDNTDNKENVTSDDKKADDEQALIGNEDVTLDDDPETSLTFSTFNLGSSGVLDPALLGESKIVKSTGKKVTSADLLSSVSMKINGKDFDGTQPISLNDTITISYNFVSPICVNYGEDVDDDTDVYVDNGDVFLFDLPNSSFDYSKLEVQHMVLDGIEFATLDFSEGKLRMTIVDDSFRKVENPVFSCSFTLDSVIAGNKDSSEVILKVGDQEYTVKIAENEPKAPTATKKGEYDATNEVINWTVNIKNDSNPVTYENGYKFVDTFKGGQEYVADSFKVNGVKAEGVTASANSIEYTVPSATTQNDVSITYQTKVTADFMKESFADNSNGSKTIEFSNEAKILDSDNKEITSATDTVPVTKEFNKWINKAGGEIDLSTGIASWTVTIDTNNYSLKNLKLYDKFDTDANTTMELVTGSLNITGPNGTLEAGGAGYNFAVSFGDVSKAGTITVTYKTQIKDFDEFLKSNRKIPENKAWISYEDEEGNGISSKDVGVGITGLSVKAGIHKDFTSYDSKNHQITWTVTANKNKQPITNVVIKDLDYPDQKLINIYDIKISDGTTMPDTTEGVLDFGDRLKGQSVTFKVVTEITDISFWSSNKSKAFTNKAEIYSENKLLASDVASKTLTSTVITKTSGSYNYDTHEIDYKVVVNENQMAMKNVSVTDELIKNGVELVEGSITVNDVATSNYTYTGGVLTIDLGDIPAGEGAKKTIQFKVMVQDKFISELKNNQSTKIHNDAVLKFDDNTAGASSGCDTPIKNVILQKIGKVNKSTGLVEYMVYLNHGKQQIPSGAIIRDTLGASFEVLLDSVHLYKCSVNSSTGELTKTDTEIPSTVSTSKDGDKTVIDVALTAGTKEPCVLVYSASMEDKSLNDFSNAVKLIGYQENADISSDYNFSSSDFSSISGSNSTRLVIHKKDAETGVLLPGATFEILDEDKNKIAETTTNSKGQARLINKLKKGNTYYLREKSAPLGYTLNTEDIKVEFNEYTMEVTVTNKKLEAEVSLDLKDTSDKSITGGHLELKRNSDNKTVFSEDTNGTAQTGKVNYDVEYTLSETKTPYGYEHGDDVVFKVTRENDKDVVKIKQDDEFVAITGNEVVIKNVKKNSFELKVNNISKEQSEKLKGSTLVISEKPDGSNPIYKWETDGLDKSFELSEGEYYILQTNGPTGFNLATSLRVKVARDSNGSLKLFSFDGTDFEPVTSNLLNIVNTVDTSKKSGISLEGVGPDGKPLEGSKVTVSVMDGGQAGNTLATGIVPNDATNGNVDVNYQTKYIAVQDEIPEGYLKADPIIFKIDSDGNIWTQNADGSFTNTGSKKLVFKNKLIPKSNPSNGSSSNGGESGSGDGNGSGSGSDSQSSSGGVTTTAASTNAQAVKKPIDMSVLPDVLGEYLGDEDESGAPRLAKTAGFFGTILSYAFGLIMLIFGMYLCFGKKNEKK